MHLRSMNGCRLAIGSYPHFYYDARGGGGEGSLLPSEKDNLRHLKFSPETFSIPALTWRTAKFLGLPLPPGLKIEMSMDKLEGTIDKDTGEVLLDFESRFIFKIGSKFRFPNLLVKTLLKTTKVKSDLHEEEGTNLQKDGNATLVGIAMIPITGNKFLDTFLNLPSEALAVLKCKIS